MSEIDIDFNKPTTLDQIEAIGALYKAMYHLAESYGLEQPHLLIAEHYSMQYGLESLLKKQADTKKLTIADDGDKPDKKPKTIGDNNRGDEPINLDDIPF